LAVSCRAVGSTVSARLHGVKHFLSIKRNLDAALKIYEVLAAHHLYFFKVLAARKTYLILLVLARINALLACSQVLAKTIRYPFKSE